MSERDIAIEGRHVLVAILLFFVGIVGVNVAFAVVAVRSFPGEDERKSYLQGLHYNDVLAERARERAHGWQASTVLVDGPVLSVRLVDASGEPLRRAVVTATLRRPASDREDRTFELREVGDGSYSFALGDLPPGVWRLRAVVQRDGQRLHVDRRLEWRSTP